MKSFIRNAKHLAVKAVSYVKGKAVAIIGGIGAGLSALSVSRPAHAVGTLTPPTIDLTDFYAVAAVIMTAIAAIWIAKKVLAFFRG